MEFGKVPRSAGSAQKIMSQTDFFCRIYHKTTVTYKESVTNELEEDFMMDGDIDVAEEHALE